MPQSADIGYEEENAFHAGATTLAGSLQAEQTAYGIVGTNSLSVARIDPQTFLCSV